MIANDFTALSVALPAIEHDFDADVSTVAVGDQRLRARVRRADRHRRPARRHVRAPAGLLHRRAIFAGLLGCSAASRPTLGVLIAARVVMGIGGAMMWPAILGMTYAALPESKAGLAGGLILGVAGIGNADRAADRRRADRRAELALDLLPQPPDRGVRDARHLAQGRTSRRTPDERRIDYAGHRDALGRRWCSLLLALDQVADWGWSDPRVIALFAARGGPAGVVRGRSSAAPASGALVPPT